MTTTTDGFNIANQGPGNYPSSKALKGGTYAFMAIATWGGGNAQLQFLAGDNTTWVNVGTSITANGMNTLDLPPGQYRIVVTTATGVYAALVGVPK